MNTTTETQRHGGEERQGEGGDAGRVRKRESEEAGERGSGKGSGRRGEREQGEEYGELVSL